MNPVSLYFRRNSRFSRSVPLKVTLPILMALATPLQAGSDVDLGAHEHGVANLTLAQDGKEISISFSAAADSVIGYEHAPANEREVAALHHAEEVLYHPEKWLMLPVSCELEAREVSLPFLSADGHKERHHGDEHDEHGHDDHDEKEHTAHDDHKHEDPDEHEHGHDGHEHEGGHVDVEASYTFHCDSEQASPLELKLFSQLPYLEQLRIEAVSERTVVVTEWEKDGSLNW